MSERVSELGRGPWLNSRRGLWRWLAGASISIVIWGFNWAHYVSQTGRIDGWSLALNVVTMGLFAITPPLSWARSNRVKVFYWLGMALSCYAFVLVTGPGTLWTVCFISSAIGMQMYDRIPGLVVLAFTEIGVIVVGRAQGADFSDLLPIIVVSASITLMMMAFARQIFALRALRATQEQLATVAVAEERNRVARDIHDILGHSLTVISVKAELASRLVTVDPERAGQEIASVQDLARGALADVRATVSGYREVSIASELANARSVLTAAGFKADLPTTAEQVGSQFRELFGWTLREATTNIIRHSGARRVVVKMDQHSIQIEDDGVGPNPSLVAHCSEDNASCKGNGLSGLRERVDAAGAALTIGSSAMGGFLVKVSA